ncbi:phage tail tape measure protein [Vibrio parahaemolyticus]|nr:phage tail tape measure protein [Vibrio parahaemolyticus]
MSEQKQKLTLVMDMVDNLTTPIMKVTDQTRKSGEAIQKTQEKIAALGKTAGNIDQFRQLEQASQDSADALDRARLKAQMMTRELSGMTNPTKKQTAEVEKQWKEVDRLEQSYQGQRDQLDQVKRTLDKTGVSTKDLNQETKRIASETRRYTQQLNQEQTALERIAKQQQRVNALKERNQKIGTAAAVDTAKVAAAGLAIKGLVSTYGEVSSAQGEIQSLGIGAEGIDKITKAAREFSQQWSGTTQADFIRASYDIKSGIASLSDEAVGQFTKIAALTAGATKSSTDQMTSLFASGYNIYRDQFDQFGAATIEGWEKMSAAERDSRFGEYFSAGIATSVKSYKTNGQEMSAAISSLGATATSANVPFSEQLAILGQLQATMSGSEAATKYAAFINSAAGAGEKLGLNFLDANDQLRSLPDILAELRGQYGDTLDAVEKQELKKAFGTDEAIDMIDLMFPKLDQLQTNITDMNQNLKGGLSTTMSMAGNILNGPNESVERFNQRLGGLMITLGKGVAPAFQFVTDKVGSVLVMITNLLERFPMLTQAIGTVVVGLLALKTGMIAMKFAQIGWNLAMITGINSMGILATLQKAMAIGAKLWASAQWVLNAALTANPIGLIIAGVAALVGVVALVVKYWEPLGAFFSGLWDSLKTTFSIGWEFIKSILAYSPLGLLMQAWEPLTEFFGGLWERVTGVFSSGMEAIAGMLSTVSGWWDSLFGDDDQTEKRLNVTQTMTGAAAALPAVTNPAAVPAFSPSQSGAMVANGGVMPAPALSVGSVPAKTGGDRHYTDNSTVEFVIHATPGMDERELAEQIDRRLAQHKRAQERRSRTTMFD